MAADRKCHWYVPGVVSSRGKTACGITVWPSGDVTGEYNVVSGYRVECADYTAGVTCERCRKAMHLS